MSEQFGWVSTRSGALFAALHAPEPSATRATAVVLVPPFGWEAVSSSRNVRGWARELAAAGHPVLRYQQPGSGDSEGDGSDQDLGTWSRALQDVLEIARRCTGADRLAVIGMGLGGLVALQAVHDGSRIEELVLWATPARGRGFLREMRAFADATPHDAQDDPGTLWVHGYPLGPRAQEQLMALDASTLDLQGIERALVLGRGTLSPDRKLVERLRECRVDVVEDHGLGYDQLTYEPRLSVPALATQELVAAWLSAERGRPHVPQLPLTPYSETRLELEGTDAVLTPAADAVLTAVFLGAGSQPRWGPNRFWTESARTWAPWGIASLRLDLHGIGEAPGPDVFPHGPEGYQDPAYRRQIGRVLDSAAALGLPDRFVLVGLSSGGYGAGQLARDDPRVVATMLLNPGTLVALPLLAAASRRYLVSAETWRRFVRDPYLRREGYARARRSAKQQAGRLVGRWTGRPVAPRTSLQVLAALEQRQVRTTVIMSPGESATEHLDRFGQGTYVEVCWLTGPTAAHTLSPAGLRAQTAALMNARARQLSELFR